MVLGTSLILSKVLLKINEDRESGSGGKEQRCLRMNVINRQFETVDPASNTQRSLVLK